MDLDYTPLSPPPTSPEIVQEIDQKIAHHAQMIINLKIERNCNQPISKLPVEVLCRIFEHSQQPCSENSTRRQKPSSPTPPFPQELSWITLTHVCHHWRYSALSARVLWTRIPLQHEKWASVFLERSRTAGLTLSIGDGKATLRPEFLDMVLSHIPRTAALTAQGLTQETMQQLIRHLSATPAPMLELVDMDAASARDRSHIFDNAPRFPIPVTVFRAARRLRHLSLNYMDAQWNSPFLSSLTTLKVADISSDARPTPMEFLSMLECNPRMRELHVQHVLTRPQSPADIDPPATRRIPLLSLETLVINGSTPTICAFLFSRIVVSGQMRRLHIRELQYDFGTSQQLSRLLVAVNEARDGQFLVSPVHANLSGTISARRYDFDTYCFSVSTSHATSTYMASSFGRNTFEVLPDEDNLDFQLEMKSLPVRDMEHYPDVKDAIRAFPDIFHALSWDRLRALDISSLTVSDPGFDHILATTFGTLSGLRAIVVGSWCANHLLDALSHNSDRDPGVYAGSVTFPALRHISFVEVTFPSDVDTPLSTAESHFGQLMTLQFADPNPSSSRGVKMGRLLDCLMDRYERGAEVHSVSISRHCDKFTQQKLEQLKEVVLTVKWARSKSYRFMGFYSEDDDY